jgi:hypothetical protein
LDVCELFLQGLPWKSSDVPGYVRAIAGTNTFSIRKVSLTADIWPSIIIEYCNRKLTLSKDKLVVVGGIARVVQERTGALYHAGLWAPGLEY